NGNHSTIFNGDANNTKGNNHLEIFTNVLTLPAGPRIINSTIGVVGENGDTLNGNHAADGAPIAESFVVTFDRPIDSTTFTNAEVVVTYRDPKGNESDVPVTAVNPVATSEVTVTD